jgi:glycosyltransferase involved in cell wall biosynthesis
MVVLEGMAAGLPVLVGTEVGLANEVSAAHAGRVVGSRPDEIATAWTELLSCSDLRNGCGQRARRLVESSFSTEAVAKRMLAVLQEIGSYRNPS